MQNFGGETLRKQLLGRHRKRCENSAKDIFLENEK
jgi:hypothetical protein